MHAFKVTDCVKDMLVDEIPEASVSLFTPPAVAGLARPAGQDHHRRSRRPRITNCKSKWTASSLRGTRPIK